MSSPSSPEFRRGPRTADEVRALLAGEPFAQYGCERPALLDVRSAPEFAAAHVSGSGSVPQVSLKALRGDLPPRDSSVLVLAGSAAAARAAAATLETFGYRSVAWLDSALAGLGTEARATTPPARLWRPAAFLAEVVAEIPRGRAADLAAGSGRDAVFLAMQGFSAEAWDLLPDALDMARSRAGRWGVAIETRTANLEARDFALPENTYALLTCFRYLHRQLFPVMVRALSPGGHLVYETYRVGQERFGHPRRARFLLGEGELKREFATLGVEVLRYEEPEPAGGPITSRLWARKQG